MHTRVQCALLGIIGPTWLAGVSCFGVVRFARNYFFVYGLHILWRPIEITIEMSILIKVINEFESFQ
jgi:hypothetical protein